MKLRRKQSSSPTIYILPTREGVFAFLVIGVMTIISLNYNNNLSFLLTFLLLGMLVVSTLFTHRNLQGLKIISASADPVFVGEEAAFRFVMDTGAEPRVQIRIRTEWGVNHASNLRSGSDTMLARIVTENRGELKLTRVTVSTSFPLGLFQAWSELPVTASCLVYPKPLKKPIDIRSAEGVGDADSKSVPIPGSDDFDGLRDYQPGDSLSRIDWRAFSRTGNLLTKNFTKESGNTPTLDFAAFRTTELEEKLSVITYWAIDYSRKGIPFSLKLPGLNLPAALGEKHLHECLKTLALFPRRA